MEDAKAAYASSSSLKASTAERYRTGRPRTRYTSISGGVANTQGVCDRKAYAIRTVLTPLPAGSRWQTVQQADSHGGEASCNLTPYFNIRPGETDPARRPEQLRRRVAALACAAGKHRLNT